MTPNDAWNVEGTVKTLRAEIVEFGFRDPAASSTDVARRILYMLQYSHGGVIMEPSDDTATVAVVTATLFLFGGRFLG